MASTAAQDEWNDLMRDKSKSKHHPSDSPVDRSDTASFLEDDSDDGRTHAPSLATTQTNSGRAKYSVPTQRHQSNTGPKGVITDAQAYRAAQRANARTSESMSRSSFQREREIASVQPYLPSGLGAHGDGKAHSDEDDDLEDDEAFMSEWRNNRLKELHGGARVGSSGREKDARRARFGGLIPVDAMGYLEAVDGSGSITVVVVYIYDDKSEVSDLFEECVHSLARKYVNTRFIKLHYLEAEMEPAGVPAILAYKGGDKFAGLIPIYNEIPDDAEVTPQTLEHLFQRHQIL